MASLILGAEEYNKTVYKRVSSFKKIQTTKGELLAEKIIKTHVKEVLDSFYTILSFMDFNDFFQLTTSLIELNLTKPTRKVG